MTAKEYLQEIRKFDRYIEQKQIEYDSLYRLRGGAGGIDYSKDKVQTSPDGQGLDVYKRQGALSMGLTEEELPDIVHRWRSANQRICDLWYKIEQAALAVMQTAQSQAINGLIFSLEGDMIYGQCFLTVRLPSGRKLFYPRPFLQENQFGKMAIHYYSCLLYTSS